LAAGEAPSHVEFGLKNIPLFGTPFGGKSVQIPAEMGLPQHIIVSSDYENLAL